MAQKVSSALRGFLNAYPPEVRKIYIATREIVLTLAPKANELIYDSYNALSSVYSFTENMKQGFIHIAAYPKHVNLGFNQGASLQDPDILLFGTGIRIRHIKIREIAALENIGALRLVEQAILQGKAMRGDKFDRKVLPGNAIVKSISAKKRRPS